jgi:hypothetical protein
MCSLFRLLCLSRRELVRRAFHPVAGPVGASRVDRVVVRRPWLEAVDTHPENRVRVGHVQPDGGLGHLAKVFGIRAVVHDAEVFRRARRRGAHPSDDGRFFRGRFERRPNDDLHTPGVLVAGDLLGNGQIEPIRPAAVPAMSARNDLVIRQVSS